MTVTDAPVERPVDRLDALEAKIDLLAEQMAVLTAEVEYRRRQREMFDDLTSDLSRVGEDALMMATRELESLSQTADPADTVRLLRRLVEVAPTLDRALVGLSAAASHPVRACELVAGSQPALGGNRRANGGLQRIVPPGAVGA